MGIRWEHSLECALVIKKDQLELISFTSPAMIFQQMAVGMKEVHGANPLSSHTLERKSDHFTLTTPNHLTLIFHLTQQAGSKIPLSAVKDRHGNVVRLFYSPQGLLTRLDDSAGRTLSFHYNEQGFLREVILDKDPQGKRSLTLVRYEHDRKGNLTAAFDGAGHAIVYYYEGESLMTRFVNRLGGGCNAIYDAKGRCICTWLDGGRKYRYLKFDEVKHTTTVTNSFGAQTLYRLNDDGLVTEEINAQGAVKKVILDANSQVITTLNEMGEAADTSIYDKDENKLTLQRLDGSTIIYQLDDRGRITEIKDAEGNSWRYEWNDQGDRLRLVVPTGDTWLVESGNRFESTRIVDPTGSYRKMWWSDQLTYNEADDIGLQVQIHFDGLGRVDRVTDGLRRTTQYSRDSVGNIIKIFRPDGSIFSMEYDPEGNLLREMDEEGRTNEYQYDVFSNCVCLINPFGKSIFFTYDSEGQLFKLTNEKGEQAFLEYDNLGRCISQTFFDGSCEHYKYDLCGRLIRISAADGQFLEIKRDGSRIVQITSSDGIRDQFEHNNKGLPSEFSRNEFSIQIARDPCGRVVTESQDDWVLEYGYDGANRRIWMRESKGGEWRYNYDKRGRVVELQEPGGRQHRFEYDAENHIVLHSTPNGLVHHLRYTVNDRVEWEQIQTAAGAILMQRSYQYDRSGLRITMRDGAQGFFEYEYDKRGFLQRVRCDGDIIGEYSFDDTGNMIHSADFDQVQISRGDRLVRAGSIQFEYDPRGRVVARLEDGSTGQQYEYLFDGSLIRVSKGNNWQARYAYDPYGRRMKKIFPEQERTTLWDGAVPVAEEIKRSESTEQITYTFFPGTFLPLSMRTSRNYFTVHTDPVGTVDVVWNERGEEVWRWNGEIWGGDRDKNDFSVNSEIPFRFLGQFFDLETGLHYNRMRYYIPKLGRYLTPDPIRFNGGTNLYWYAPDPINWVDPFGLQLTVLGHTIPPISPSPMPAGGQNWDVYRVDCSKITSGPPNVCTSPRGVPRQRPLNRPNAAGGGPAHNACVDALANTCMSTESGFVLERLNQAQVGWVTGVSQKLGRNRPDAFGGGAGTNVYGECDNDQANSEAHAEQICQNDPNGIVYLAVAQ